MSRWRTRPPALLVLGMVLVALAAVGVGYGLWAEVLRIEGVVQTGEVEASWIRTTCMEFHPWPGGGFPGEAEGKDVGVTTAAPDPFDDRILNVTLTNVYPSYAVDCEVRFEIGGTIPVIVRGTKIVAGPNLTNCRFEETPDGNEKTMICDQLTVIFTDNLGSQLHPGGRAASSLTVHVEQAASQNATYGFKVLVCLAQWNERVTAEECFAAP